MYDDAYAELLDTFDKWDNRDKLHRFRARMEHKMHAKEGRYGRRRR